MKAKSIIAVILSVIVTTTAGAQKVAVRNNLLYDATTTMNLGVEFRTGARTTLLLPAGLNVWEFDDNRKFKHVLAQPEFRWWTCEPFTGHFWGIHAHWAYYNVGGVGPFAKMREYRYEGWLAGAGISYGYSWILSPRLSLEATVGVGYAYMAHDKYPYRKCGPLIGSETKHYFGPTKAGLTLVFMIK